MHPLKQLRQLLQEVPSSSTGIVLATTGDDLKVATRLGMCSLTRSNTDATHYRIGDQVVIANGVVIGRQRITHPSIYVL